MFLIHQVPQPGECDRANRHRAGFLLLASPSKLPLYDAPAMTSFDATKAHAIGVHFQALSFDFITIASRCLIAFNELSPTTYTNVVLFTSFDPILTYMS